MTKRNWWRVGFLSVSALWLSLELLAAFDGSPDTEPLTDFIVANWPVEISALAFGGLLAWVLAHFWLRYRKKGEP